METEPAVSILVPATTTIPQPSIAQSVSWSSEERARGRDSRSIRQQEPSPHSATGFEVRHVHFGQRFDGACLHTKNRGAARRLRMQRTKDLARWRATS